MLQLRLPKLLKKQHLHAGGGPEPPREIYNAKLVILAVTAAFAAVIIGYDAGFIGGTVSLASFREDFGMNSMPVAEQNLINANVISVFQAGAFWGCLFMYPLGELVGRKIGLSLSGFLLVFGAAISLAASSRRGLGPVYAGRVLTGLGIGGCSALAPIYVLEISPADIRGKLVGVWELLWQIGGVTGFWINYGVLQHIPDLRKQWIIPFAIQLVPSGIFLLGTFLLPESPRFLIAKGKLETARKNLCYLRNLPPTHPYTNYEMGVMEADIKARVRATGGGFFGPLRALCKTKVIYRLFLSTSLFLMQNGYGINAITYNSPTIFKSFGISGSDTGLLSTGIFGIIKALASLVWMLFIVDKVGRRKSLIVFSLPCSVAMWYIGAYIKVADPSARLAKGDTQLNSGGRAALAMLYIWLVFYGVTWNGTPWVVSSEFFSQEVRTATQAINASSNWFWAFIMGRFTGQAYEAMGYGLYFLFAACSMIFPGVVYLLVPESKGVPLEAVEYLFEVPAWRAHKYAMDKYAAEKVDGFVEEASEVLSEMDEKARVTTVENVEE